MASPRELAATSKRGETAQPGVTQQVASPQ